MKQMNMKSNNTHELAHSPPNSGEKIELPAPYVFRVESIEDLLNEGLKRSNNEKIIAQFSDTLNQPKNDLVWCSEKLQKSLQMAPVNFTSCMFIDETEDVMNGITQEDQPVIKRKSSTAKRPTDKDQCQFSFKVGKHKITSASFILENAQKDHRK
jgi:hypothetical protein